MAKFFEVGVEVLFYGANVAKNLLFEVCVRDPAAVFVKADGDGAGGVGVGW